MNTYKNGILAILLLCGSAVFSQESKNDETKDRIEALRISFITQKLSLTPEEAQVFWPIYNQYRAELKEIIGSRADGPHRRRSRPDIDSMTDEEVKKMLDQEWKRQKGLLDLRKKYEVLFAKVLPIKKVAKLFEAERDFQRQLIRELSKKDRGNPK